MNSLNPSALRPFLEPKSVAIVGASRTSGKFSNNILRNLLTLGYSGKIYPVNPREEEILGLKAYPKVTAIPDSVDLVVIILPAPHAPQIMEDCAQKGVPAVLILASGFAEIGGEGIELQRKVIDIGRRAGIRILGPNTTGVLNPDKNFATGFAPLSKLKKGSVAFVAQTGMFAGIPYMWITTAQHLGVSKVIGLGNKCDISELEALAYLAEDLETTVIVMYLEGVTDGRQFLDIARATTKKKPVLILKSGRTEAGAKAASSHTATMVGRDEVFDAACKQAGVLRMNTLEEAIDIAKAFSFQPLPAGNRVAIVSVTGGGGVLASDFCMANNLDLAHLSTQTIQRIKKVVAPWAMISNPVDMPRGIQLEGVNEVYHEILQALLDDEGVDSILLNLILGGGFSPDLRFFTEMPKKYFHKPLFISTLGEKNIMEAATAGLHEEKIPVYSSPERALNAIAALCKYKEIKDAG